MDESIYAIVQLSENDPITEEHKNEALKLALELVPEIPNMTPAQKGRFTDAVMTLNDA